MFAAIRFSSSRRLLWVVLFLVSLFGFDRALKFFSIGVWSIQPLHMLPGVDLVFLLNPGIAFSVPLGGPLLTLLLIGMVVILLVWFFRAFKRRQLQILLFLSSVLLGAYSNILDRLLYSGVVDYLRIGPLPVINIADLMIVIGVVGLVFVRPRGGLTKS